MKNIAFVFFISIFGMSCSSDVENKPNKYDKSILGNWILLEATEISGSSQSNTGSGELKKDLNGSNLVKKGYILNVFSDSSFTNMIGYESEFGTWSYVSNDVLEFGNSTLQVELIEESSFHKTLSGVITRGEKKFKALFESEIDLANSDCTLNPFHAVNNQWRIRPNSSETYEQIRHRLTNYLLHNALLFKHAAEFKKKNIVIKFSGGILKFYEGGIGLLPERLMNKNWEACFYDSKEAMNAYYLFDTYLDNKLYRGNKDTKNWLSEDYLLLLKLYEDINAKTKAEQEAFTRKQYGF